jgi:hypothetical protein
VSLNMLYRISPILRLQQALVAGGTSRTTTNHSSTSEAQTQSLDRLTHAACMHIVENSPSAPMSPRPAVCRPTAAVPVVKGALSLASPALEPMLVVMRDAKNK